MDQNKSLMHELDDRLSVVKRWGIVRTIGVQSVAEHCFNVQRICIKLAPHLGIDDYGEMFELSQAALHHDDDEAVTGDIPGPAKIHVRATEKGVDVGATAWYTDSSDAIKAIVKLADMLEAYHFLTMEFHLGNFYLRRHRLALRAKIEQHIESQTSWPPSIEALCNEWIAAITQETSKVHPDAITGGSKQGAKREPG